MRKGFLTNHDVERMRDLATLGRKVSRIAWEIGCSPSTVYRYVKTEVRESRARPSRIELAERARMIVATYDATPPGKRLALAKPLGFSSPLSLRVRVYQIRRRMREAEMQEAA